MKNDHSQQEDWPYSDIVRDHFFNPRNYWPGEKYEGADGTGTAGSPVCGDLMKVWIKVDTKTKKITECKWQTFGCASAIASTSMMSVMVTEHGGMALEEAKKMDAQKILDRLGGLPENKIHCSVLGHLALRDAIDDYSNFKKRTTVPQHLPKSKMFVLNDKKQETSDVSTLTFIGAEGKMFAFKAGQFVLCQILSSKPELSPVIRAYTITNSPDDNFLALTIKRAGIFSNALCDLERGEQVKITGPYGCLYPEPPYKKDIVFLAGGIGITPFYTIIKELVKKKVDTKMYLFYSNKTNGDVLFLDEFQKMSEKRPTFKVICVLTRDKEKYSHVEEYKRITSDTIQKYAGALTGKQYLICGSSDFVIGLKEQLENNKVNRDDIKIESF